MARWLTPALILAVDLDDEDVRGRCIGSRADSGVPPALSLRRNEKALMFGSKSGTTSPSVGLDHRVATRRLDDEPVPSLDEPGVCPGDPPASARTELVMKAAHAGALGQGSRAGGAPEASRHAGRRFSRSHPPRLAAAAGRANSLLSAHIAVHRGGWGRQAHAQREAGRGEPHV
jgi:hypothetical protein